MYLLCHLPHRPHDSQQLDCLHKPDVQHSQCEACIELLLHERLAQLPAVPWFISKPQLTTNDSAQVAPDFVEPGMEAEVAVGKLL